MNDVAPHDTPPLLSVVIPAFNSATVVATTVQETIEVLRAEPHPFEIILVDDGSKDATWQVLERLAEETEEVRSIRLLRNYGQHNANLAGLRASRGTWIVTMDDDGQNPPHEIPEMLRTAESGGHDVVFGRFDEKKASGVRTLGSSIVGTLNRMVFEKPTGLVVSNHRILHRTVVDRICTDASRYPYITGQALLYSSSPVNVDVEHRPRQDGSSSYNLTRILTLVFRILFSYSLAPLHVAAVTGGGIAIFSFVIGAAYLARGIVAGTAVPGWTTLVVLLAFFQGVTLLMLAMLGEYVVRTLNQVSARPTYHIATTVDG